ncbi:deoxyuridine 5'-triphosphate nucleotidohydrolase-like [Aegotheles albertisi]
MGALRSRGAAAAAAQGPALSLSVTGGSAGVDLATAVEVMLKNTEVVLIDSTEKGPLGHGLSALLIGRSSVSQKGIFVIPGLIDADYTGVIKVMVYTLTPPVTILKGAKIAQLIPFQALVPTAMSRKGGIRDSAQQGIPMCCWQ